MAGLLTAAQVTCFSGIFADHFTTFARNIVVNKVPEETINVIPPPDYYPGYEAPSVPETSITYVYRSGIYPAIVRYDKKQDIISSIEGRFDISKGQVLIKVEESGKKFIEDGPNENFVVDDMVFNSISDRAVQNYLGLKYYYYLLERTT